MALLISCFVKLYKISSSDSVESERFRTIIDSFSKEMISCNLEDFNLDKSCDYKSDDLEANTNRIKIQILSEVSEALLEYNLMTKDASEDNLSAALSYFRQLKILRVISSAFVKTSISKLNKYQHPPILHLATISTVVVAVFGKFAQYNIIAEDQEFISYLLHAGLQLLKVLMTSQCIDVDVDSQQTISLLRAVFCKYKELLPSTTKETETDLEIYAEITATSLSLVACNFPEQTSQMFKAIGENIENENEDLHLYIYNVILQFQKLVEECLEKKFNKLSWFHLISIENCLNFLRTDSRHDEFILKVLQWLLNICQTCDLGNSIQCKQTLNFLLTWSRPQRSVIPILSDLCNDVHFILGNLDKETRNEAELQCFSCFNNNKVSAAILPLCLSTIDYEIDDLIWALKRESVHSPRGVDDDDDSWNAIETERIHRNKKIVTRTGLLLRCTQDIVRSAIPYSSSIEFVVKVLTNMYSLLEAITKYYATLYQNNSGIVSQQYQKLIRLSGVCLTQNVYAFITYIQTSQSEALLSAKDKAPNNKKVTSLGKSKILKEMKTIPNLIFAIEQFEKFLIQLSKKSKINLMESMKLTTSRDFRINASVLKHAINRLADDDNEVTQISDDDSSDVTEKDSTKSKNQKKALLNKKSPSQKKNVTINNNSQPKSKKKAKTPKKDIENKSRNCNENSNTLNVSINDNTNNKISQGSQDVVKKPSPRKRKSNIINNEEKKRKITKKGFKAPTRI